MRWDEYDRYGNQIYLTDERWEHALEKRPWLCDYFDDVLDTIAENMTENGITGEKYEYDQEGDVLDVYFDDVHFSERTPTWTIELTPNIMISIDRSAKSPRQLTLMDYSELIRLADGSPNSFPIIGLANMPADERSLVLTILSSEPVNRWLDISTVQTLPDSPFTVTHLEPPPKPLQMLIPVPV